MSWLVALALAVRSVVATEPAHEHEVEVEVQRPSAPAAPDRDPATVAAELFADGRYAEAAAAFEAAYRETGDPAFLFGHAQALRFGGNCGGAIELFEAFIETGPPEPDVAEARRVIAACREILDQGPTPDPVVTTPQAPPEPEPAPAPEPAPKRWSRDVLGGVLVGGGILLAAGGAGLYGASFALARDRMETEAEYERRGRTVRATSASGIALMAAGGALLVGGIVRWAIVARREGRGTARHGLAPLAWRF